MTIYNWAENLYNLFTFTVLIPIGIGLSRWRNLTRSERWVLVFLIVLLTHELLSILGIALHTRNHFLYYFQTIGVLYSVAGVYAGLIGPRRFVWQTATVVSLLMVIEVGFWVKFNHINSITLTISRLLPAIYASILLNRSFSTKATPSLTPGSMLYIHLGFFLYGAFTAVNVYFKSYFIENSLDLYYFFSTMSAMISSVAFGLFSLGFSRAKLLYKV